MTGPLFVAGDAWKKRKVFGPGKVRACFFADMGRSVSSSSLELRGRFLGFTGLAAGWSFLMYLRLGFGAGGGGEAAVGGAALGRLKLSLMPLAGKGVCMSSVGD